VVQGAGHKAKRLALQCINGASSNPVEGRTKISQFKDLILTVWFNFQTYIIFSINLVSQVLLINLVAFLKWDHVNSNKSLINPG
jgi:hypothetical protein